MGLIIDNFAGGGGASTGIERALGRAIDVAINHDPEAVAMHMANHPLTRHHCQSVWKADPLEVTGGQPVDLAWFSPDCKHFSKAKGGAPRAKHIRDLAWVVVMWAQRVRPSVIMLENVEEFRGWGPLGEDGQPIRERAGETFDKWTKALRKEGYKIQWKELRACDYGAPTSRKRFFMIARCDSKPIVWPEPTHGKPGTPEVESGQRKPWRAAAEIIDWSIDCPSIFERKRPLKDATCRRIAAGIVRFVLNNPRPFIVPMTHHGPASRLYDVEQPIPTVTGAHRGEMAIVAPYFARTAHGEADRNGKKRGKGQHSAEDSFPTVTQSQDSALITATLANLGHGERRKGEAPRVADIDEPVSTIMAGGGKHAAVTAFLSKFSENSIGIPPTEPLHTVMAGAPRHAVVTAHIAQHNGGNGASPRSAESPLSTVTQRGTQQQIVTSNLVKLQNNQDAKSVDDPIDTILAGGWHYGEVRAFLTKYYGSEEGGHTVEDPLATVTTKERFGLVTVTVDGHEYAISDIGMRMLSARELFSAQSFPPDYDIECVATNGGKPLTKTSQIAKCGNSVPPVMSEALVSANFQRAIEERAVA